MRTKVTTSLITLLLLSVATIAAARPRDACSMASLSGDWALTVTGTVFLPTGSAPLATVGRLTFDDQGNMSAKQTNSVGGVVSRNETVVGQVLTLDRDCTGEFTVNVYDPTGTILLRTAYFDFFIDDNATELRAIATSLSRNGESVLPVLSFNARRLFPRNGQKP